MSFPRRLFDELKRRRVFRVAAAYAVVAWLVIQVASETFPALGLPAWTLTLVVACALLGCPVAIVLAWAFDVTPEGVRRTSEGLPASVDPLRQGRPSSSRSPWAYAVAGVTVVVLLATGTFLALRPTTAPAVADTPPERPSIAVLQFEDLSAAGDQEYFGQGLAEELLNALAQTEGLRVVARTSSFSFAGKDTPVHEIGRQLSAGLVLEGSVRAAGGSVRVTAQLIDAGTGYHVWSQTYERKLADVFAIQDEIAAAIANALELRLLGDGAGSSRRARARDSEAVRQYLRGRHAFSQRTAEGLQESVGHFVRALELDPTFALAYAGLADAYTLLDDYGMLEREEAYAKGTDAARRALDLDETLAEAHTSLAHILMHQLQNEDSEREFRRALELNPSHVQAHQWYALLLCQMRRWDEAIEHARRAAELDPLSFPPARGVGIVLSLARRTDEAVAQLEATLVQHPDNESVMDFLTLVYVQAGRYDDATALSRVLEERYPGPYYRGQLAVVHAAAGRSEEARRLLAELEDDFAYRSQLALAWAYLGDLDRAFLWLDRAIEAREAVLDFMEIGPEWDPLRGDARFTAALRKTGHLP